MGTLFRRFHEFTIDPVGVIRIRNISEREHAALFEGEPEPDQLLRRLIALSLVSVAGEPVQVTEDEVGDIDIVYAKRLASEVVRFTGFDSGNGESSEDDSSTGSPA